MGNHEIFIKKGLSLVKLKLKDIFYIEAPESHVTLNTKIERFPIHFTITAIEKEFPSEIFIRVHRSFIVNKSRIKTIKEDSLDLNLGDTLINLPVDNSYRDFLLSEIKVMAL